MEVSGQLHAPATLPLLPNLQTMPLPHRTRCNILIFDVSKLVGRRTIKNEISFHEEIKNRLNSGNAPTTRSRNVSVPVCHVKCHTDLLQFRVLYCMRVWIAASVPLKSERAARTPSVQCASGQGRSVRSWAWGNMSTTSACSTVQILHGVHAYLVKYSPIRKMFHTKFVRFV
jgi:hypothetical protein